jgi:ribokinase
VTARITVAGSLNMDLVIHSPRIPQPGETIIGGDFQMAPGGKGANQAVAAARLGAQVWMVGRVGKDAFGQSLLNGLLADGVDHTYVTQDSETASGVASIVVDEAGQNSIVVASGANGRLSPADINAAKKVIIGADVLLLQLESPLETVLEAAQIAHAHGVTVILNPAPARPLPAELFPLVDVLIPNESETTLLTDMPVDDRNQAEVAATALRELGLNLVVLTLGKRGALLAQKGKTIRVPAFNVTPVDTTAAGDAFVGGFAVALAEGKSPVDAVRWANAAGALATTQPGAQPSLPTRHMVENLLAE